MKEEDRLKIISKTKRIRGNAKKSSHKTVS